VNFIRKINNISTAKFYAIMAVLVVVLTATIIVLLTEMARCMQVGC
jgi:hypothetical protein